MGFASSPATRNALAPYGITATGFRWKWGLGLKGGTFPPHRSMNGQVSGMEGFDVVPGDDVNGDTCMCWMVPAYRTPDGRLAKAGLTPAFIPAVTASAVEVWKPEPLNLEPLAEAFNAWSEAFQNVTVNIPEGAIRVQVAFPEIPTPNVIVESPTVQVDVAAPNVTVEAPDVTVEPTTVNVAAPDVTVTPQIVVKPAPVKIIREKAARMVRFRRNTLGQIEEAEVTE